MAIRKGGSRFPGNKSRVTSEPDYRGRCHELLMQRDSLRAVDRVLLVDDWVETGSQARAVHQLVRQRGAHLLGVSVVVDQRDPSDPGEPDDVFRLVRFADLPDPS